jgi:ABC-type glycerol-3-phosphate transport system permease component
MVAEEQLRQRAVRNRAVMMDGANLMQIICKVTLPLGRLRSPISLAVASRTMV